MKKTMMLQLPDENMTNGKFRTDRKTSQFCVIPNTEGNRDSIRHFNKLAKEQNSLFRLKMRYRCPKEGKHYGWGGDVACEDANGIGIYINGATNSNGLWDEREYWKSRLKEKDNEISLLVKKNNAEEVVSSVRNDEMDKVILENLRLKEKEVELRKIYEKYHDAMKENQSLKNEIASKNAIEHLESACGDYLGENGEDDTYEKMCGMVDSLWNYDKETQV